MKNFGIFALALVAVCIAGSSAQSHNVTWGYVGPYDHLLYREIVQKSSKTLQIVTKDVTFPDNNGFNKRNISAIRITDQYVNGKGGYATLLKGGVNFANATIHFKSQRGHGFNFIMEIFTRY